MYLQFLKKDLENKKEKNGEYSLRAYAKFLGMSHGSLSMVLAGKRGISTPTIDKIAEKLNLSFQDKELFRLSALSAFARSKKEKNIAKNKVQTLIKDSNIKMIKENDIAIINHWLYIAVFEVISSFDVTTFKSLSDYFPKHTDRLQSVLAALQKLDVISSNDQGYSAVVRGIQTFNDIPSQSIKEFHATVCQKAIQSLSEHDVQTREFQNTILMFPLKKLKPAKKLIRNFIINFNDFVFDDFDPQNLSSQDEAKIYSLSINFFQLD